MKQCFFLLGLLSIPQVAHARLLPTLDMDALVFFSDAIVEGTIVAARTQNYERSADVRVEKTWLGQNFTGQTMTVSDLSLYRKGQPWIRVARLETRIVGGKKVHKYVTLPPQQQQQMTRLGSKDRAIFFLWKPSAHPTRFSRPRGVGFHALSSGVYLIRQNEVAGFTQMSNPGPYCETYGKARDQFDAAFAASRARVGYLKARLQAPPQQKDADYFRRWKTLREKAVAQNRWRGVDGITQKLNERLQQIAQLNSPTV